MRRRGWMVLPGLVLLLLLSAGVAASAANVVPPTWLGESRFAVTANALKPEACAALSLSNLVVGSGILNGTNNNDLILGSPGNDVIRGNRGGDCILGGGGNDTLYGDQGNDVLIGGPDDDVLYGDQGGDVLIGGGGYDICDGGRGGGADSFDSCEEIYR